MRAHRDTAPARATADCATREMFPVVWTKVVPVDSREVSAKAPHPPPTMATKLQASFPVAIKAAEGPASGAALKCTCSA